jgi:hypothetical protein
MTGSQEVEPKGLILGLLLGTIVSVVLNVVMAPKSNQTNLSGRA